MELSQDQVFFFIVKTRHYSAWGGSCTNHWHCVECVFTLTHIPSAVNTIDEFICADVRCLGYVQQSWRIFSKSSSIITCVEFTPTVSAVGLQVWEDKRRWNSCCPAAWYSSVTINLTNPRPTQTRASDRLESSCVQSRVWCHVEVGESTRWSASLLTWRRSTHHMSATLNIWDILQLLAVTDEFVSQQQQIWHLKAAPVLFSWKQT